MGWCGIGINIFIFLFIYDIKEKSMGKNKKVRWCRGCQYQPNSLAFIIWIDFTEKALYMHILLLKNLIRQKAFIFSEKKKESRKHFCLLWSRELYVNRKSSWKVALHLSSFLFSYLFFTFETMTKWTGNSTSHHSIY